MEVLANDQYVFDPCEYDKKNPPLGVYLKMMKKGDVIKVVDSPACPIINKYKFVWVKVWSCDRWEFTGIVHKNSLAPCKDLKYESKSQ